MMVAPQEKIDAVKRRTDNLAGILSVTALHSQGDPGVTQPDRVPLRRAAGRVLVIVLAILVVGWGLSGGVYVRSWKSYNDVAFPGRDSNKTYKLFSFGAGSSEYNPWRVSSSTEHEPYKLQLAASFPPTFPYRSFQVESMVLKYPGEKTMDVASLRGKVFPLRERGLREPEVTLDATLLDVVPVDFAAHAYYEVNLVASLQSADEEPVTVVLNRRFRRQREFFVAPLFTMNSP